jgi:hypothetical protein
MPRKNEGGGSSASAAAALGAGFLALAWAIRPLGEFPLNDDYAYAWSVRQLLSGAGFRISEVASPSSLIHVLWGALFARAAGPSDQVLRLSGAIMGCLAVLAFFFLLRRALGLDARKSLLGAALLLVNPIFLAMCFSFHTDTTFLALMLAACGFYLAALSKPGRREELWGGALFAQLAVLTRQFGVLTALGAGAALLRRRRWLEALVAFVPPALALAAFEFWFRRQGGNWAAETQNILLAARLARPLTVLDEGLLRAAGIFCTLGLFLSPLALGFAERKLLRLPARREILPLGAAAALSAYAVLRWGALPYLENTLSRRGLGVVSLWAPEAKAAGFLGSVPFWIFLTVVGFASAFILLRVCLETSDDDGARKNLSWIFIPQAIPLLLMPVAYDRYLLPLLPGAAAYCLLAARARKLRPRAAAAGALALALFSAAGLRDYFAWHRAASELAQRAVAAGVPRAAVENGFDWDAENKYPDAMASLLARKPRAEIGTWEWMTVNRTLALTSFDPKPPQGLTPVDRASYWSPLTFREEFVYLHALTRRSASGMNGNSSREEF